MALHNQRMKNALFLLSLIFITSVSYAKNYSPELSLAKNYKGQVDLSDYWVSEKLDGIRAYWDGKRLISRQGNIFPAPYWFTKNFPSQALDGELWLDRGKFQRLMSIVSKKRPSTQNGKKLATMSSTNLRPTHLLLNAQKIFNNKLIT